MRERLALVAVTVKRNLLMLLKVAIPVAIIAWLLSRLEADQVDRLRNHPKDWPLLSAAFLVAFGAVSLTFVRWWLLVWTLGLPFRLRDAFRLGFLGYLLNFVSVGAVGGDLFKAVFIAREQPGRRAEAVATVLVDRVIGLYALLIVASSAILASGPSESVAVQRLSQLTLLATAVGGVGIVTLLLPTLTNGRISAWAGSLPAIGPPLRKVIGGVRLYKSRPLVMVLIALMSVAVHVLLSVSMWLIAKAMFQQVPTMAEHLIITPMAMTAGALPFTPGGLGALEAAMDELYRLIPSGQHAVSGVLVALVYRLMTLGIAGVGALFYVAGRQEVRQIMEEAENAV